MCVPCAIRFKFKEIHLTHTDMKKAGRFATADPPIITFIIFAIIYIFLKKADFSLDPDHHLHH
jgi:hypothetical protein